MLLLIVFTIGFIIGTIAGIGFTWLAYKQALSDSL
jgi:hypothetical protein